MHSTVPANLVLCPMTRNTGLANGLAADQEANGKQRKARAYASMSTPSSLNGNSVDLRDPTRGEIRAEAHVRPVLDRTTVAAGIGYWVGSPGRLPDELSRDEAGQLEGAAG